MITAPAVTGKLRALTVRTYTSLVISGHRGILPSGDSNYLARLRGIWYTIDRQLADYTKPGCGIKLTSQAQKCKAADRPNTLLRAMSQMVHLAAHDLDVYRQGARRGRACSVCLETGLPRS
jgi:hypothetical protein